MAQTNSFNHPQCGRSERDTQKLAILWEPGTTADRKKEVLEKYGLTPICFDGKETKYRVNQTDALSWVESDKALSVQALRALEKSDAVHWTAGVFRGRTGPDGLEGLFCVNPTRLYVTTEADARVGGVANLDIAASVDDKRSARLRGLVALTIPNASLADGRTAIELAANLTKRLTGAMIKANR